MNTSDNIIVRFKISKDTYDKINFFKTFCIAVEQDFDEFFNSCLSDFLDCFFQSFDLNE